MAEFIGNAAKIVANNVAVRKACQHCVIHPLTDEPAAITSLIRLVDADF